MATAGPRGGTDTGVPWGAFGVLAGGILGAIGAILDWVSLTPQRLPERLGRFEGQPFPVGGLDVLDGKVLLALSLAAVVAALAMLAMARGSAAWGVAWAAAAGGAVVWVLGGLHLLFPRTRLLGLIIDRFTPPRAPNPERIENAVLEAFDNGLLVVARGTGLYLMLIAGILIVGGAVAVLLRGRPAAVPGPASGGAAPTEPIPPA